MRPIWLCPIGHHDRSAPFDLFPLDPDRMYVNFGFWDAVRLRERHEPGYLNRKIESKVSELRGLKSLYSDSYFSEDEFWSIYNRQRYDTLKRRYDPQGRFKDLYQKTVLRG